MGRDGTEKVLVDLDGSGFRNSCFVGNIVNAYKWNLMDVLFLGSAGIFAVVWLVLLAVNQSNNAYNGAEKGWTGQNAGEVKQFHVHFSPVMIGMVVFIIISLVVTVIYYAEYF